MSNGRVSRWLLATRGTEPPGLAAAHLDHRLLLVARGRGGVKQITKHRDFYCQAWLITHQK